MKLSTPANPRTSVPDSPCTDPYQGAPSATDKRAAKCTIAASPDCTKIQERFSLIQASIQDERDDLQEEIQDMEGKCKEVKFNIDQQIKNAEAELDDQQTKL